MTKLSVPIVSFAANTMSYTYWIAYIFSNTKKIRIVLFHRKQQAFLSSKSFGITPDSKIFRIIERYNSWECIIFALQMWNFSVRIRQFISSCFSPRTFSEILSLLSFPFLFEESGGLSVHSLYYNQSGSVSPWMKMIEVQIYWQWNLWKEKPMKTIKSR